MPDCSVHACITSPPYWGLRDYGIAGQIGTERAPDEYVARLVAVFHEVRRVLRDDGTLWVNLGDSLREKQLIGIPWRVAFALQADGWFLRCDIIWAKPNPMPESVNDRPTRSHEYVFLLSKQERYYYDIEAIREDVAISQRGRVRCDTIGGKAWEQRGQHSPGGSYAKTKPRRIVPDLRESGSSSRIQDQGLQTGIFEAFDQPERQEALLLEKRISGDEYAEGLDRRNRRTVWTFPTYPVPDAHFATFPIELPEICLCAGAPKGGVVLDPFAGTATTGLAAIKNGRRFVGIELNAEYIEIARRRFDQHMPLLAHTV